MEANVEAHSLNELSLFSIRRLRRFHRLSMLIERVEADVGRYSLNELSFFSIRRLRILRRLFLDF
jgi:hypothetical protein